MSPPPRHRRRNTSMRFGAVLTAALISAGLVTLAGSAQAQTAPTLGTAEDFAVLAGSRVTNTGPSIIGGDLGTSPTPAITGFPPGIVVAGTIHAADGVAAQAQADALVAYNQLAGQPCDDNLSGQDLGGQQLTSGVYCFDTSAQLTGALTLNGQGDPDSVFIFQIGSTLITGSGSSVSLINGASPCNVFWQVGSSATLGTTTSFVGTIIANTSNTLNTTATLIGRALALNGAVTLDTNTITTPLCDDDTTGGTTVGPTTGGTTVGPTTGGTTVGPTTGGTTTGPTTGGVTTGGMTTGGMTTGGTTTGVTTGGVTTGGVTTGGLTTGGVTTGGLTTGGNTTRGGDH